MTKQIQVQVGLILLQQIFVPKPAWIDETASEGFFYQTPSGEDTYVTPHIWCKRTEDGFGWMGVVMMSHDTENL